MLQRDEIRNRLRYAIPQFWQKIVEVENLQDRGADELAIWATEFFRYVNSRSVLTADSEYLKKWEAMYLIPSDENKPLSERRSVILAKLRGVGTVNVSMIKNMAESFEFGEVEVIPVNGGVMIEFVSNLGIPPNLEDMQRALREIIPAHLEIHFDFKFLEYAEFLGMPYYRLTSRTYAELMVDPIEADSGTNEVLEGYTHDQLSQVTHANMTTEGGE